MKRAAVIHAGEGRATHRKPWRTSERLETVQQYRQGIQWCGAAVESGEAAPAQDGKTQVRDEQQVVPLVPEEEVCVRVGELNGIRRASADVVLVEVIRCECSLDAAGR